MPLPRRKKTSRMTLIVLLVSFILLAARLIFVIPGAIEHHQQKQHDAPVPTVIAK